MFSSVYRRDIFGHSVHLYDFEPVHFIPSSKHHWTVMINLFWQYTENKTFFAQMMDLMS